MTPGYWHAWARTETRKQWRLLAKVTALAILLLSLLGWFGCSREECEALPPLQLPEKAGGVVEKVVRENLQVELAAATPPGACPLYVAPMASADVCLQQHELTHVDQYNAAGFLPDGASIYVLRYGYQLSTCWLKAGLALDAFHPCYLAVDYEVAARAVQDACSARGTP